MIQVCFKKVEARKTLSLILQRFWLREIIRFKKSGWLQDSLTANLLENIKNFFKLFFKYFSFLNACCKYNAKFIICEKYVFPGYFKICKKCIYYVIAKCLYCCLKEHRCFIDCWSCFRKHGAALTRKSVMVWVRRCCWVWSLTKDALTILFCWGHDHRELDRAHRLLLMVIKQSSLVMAFYYWLME